ncbi:hypothetical protein FIBSPDRAFT_216314 [Athelia psychrophila]|uniref:Uncharacterized protein n=1 Tax=Athelia psychrophila TaxID=1759441 RepID=A0A166SEZ8_9AGAM|nr:hypothetical protein FIBSPDRAFT_216314 [Fibularhizoctonia sp. CBS 109695]
MGSQSAKNDEKEQDLEVREVYSGVAGHGHIDITMDERLDQKGGMHMNVPHLPQPSVHTPATDFLPQTWKEVSMDVVLMGKKYNIIDSITIEDFRVELTTTAETYAPLVGSNTTLAT